MLCKFIRRFHKVLAIGALIIPIGNRTFAQEKVTGTYHSEIDDMLTIEKVSVLPFTDNLQGIYARPIEAHFITLVDQMHRWNYIASNTSGPILSPDELESSPEKAIQVSQGLGVDAFFAGRITKGPNGITVHISLLLAKDGKLLSQAVLKDYKQFNLADLKEQTQRLLSEIVARLPYSGRVLSRDGNRVTVNLGLKDGIQAGQMLSVIQIIQAKRHPKFNFLISTEKEIFGKLKILKVDESLSFATVMTEKEKGAIQKNSKIGPLDFVVYSGGEDLALSGKPEDSLGQREDGKMVFGKDAHAWQPQAPPTFGQVGGRLGFSQVQESAELGGGVGPQSASDNLSPSILLEGEIWVTPEFTFHARLKQGIVSVTNPRPGSTSAKLNQQVSTYEAGFGYMFRFGPYVTSPNVEPFLGYFTHRLYTDDTTPHTFTTTDYSGVKLGVRGSTPVGLNDEYGVGGEFGFAWKPTLRESPYSSGDSNTANVFQMGIFGFKKLGERLKAVVQLDFEMYSATFDGSGSGTQSASSSSQKFTTLSGGLYYMF
ncbi:MAG: hypothetical protein ACXVA9_03315 [Bdellovibrionales bacterium]